MDASAANNEEDTDWNVDEVKGDHESDEHWELRRNFLLKNKGSYPKLRLLSLSQVFANHEFLGCRYPEETMQLVAELSAGIVEEYRTARQGRLQRTFVKASDAAERKSKGSMKRVWTPTPPIFGQNRFKHPMKVFVRESPASPSIPETCDTVSPLPELCPDDGVAGRMENQLEAALSQYGDDLRGLVLVDQIFLDKEGALQTINRSCGMSHKPLKVEYGTEPNCGTVQCVIQIGSSFVQEGRGFSKETARQEAASRVLTALRQLCYTIEVKANVVAATEFGKTDIHSHSLGKKDSDHSLTENNVGNKLLRLMGWTDGKGLGKDGQGIQDPISASSEVVKRSRLGLGMSDSNESNFGTKVKTFLTRQMWQCDQFDLQFTPEFSPDERKIIHQIAGQLGLRSRSHGKGNNRFLVVSRKVELVQLVQELLTLGESAKYRVIPPGILNSQQSTDLLHNNNSSATS